MQETLPLFDLLLQSLAVGSNERVVDDESKRAYFGGGDQVYQVLVRKLELIVDLIEIEGEE